MSTTVEIARLTGQTKIRSRFIRVLSLQVRRSEMSEEGGSSRNKMEVGQPQAGNQGGTTFRAAYARKVDLETRF